MKTKDIQIKSRITAPGFDLAGHATFRCCLDISPSEIVCALFNQSNELIYLQHYALKANEKIAEALEYLIETDPFFSQNYAHVDVCISNNIYTLVPATLFVKENREELLKFNHTVSKEMIILSDEIVSADSHCVYAADKKVKDLLDKVFPNNHIKHKTSCLIEGLPAIASKTHKTCLVNVSGNSMDVALYNKKLLFFNTFEFQTAEDFLYFILAVLEQNNCALDETEIVLAGEIETGSALYLTLKQYIPKLKFAVANKAIIRRNDFVKLPDHFHYTLFNLYLCAL